jgi:hypothetical protein
VLDPVGLTFKLLPQVLNMFAQGSLLVHNDLLFLLHL